ncbi:hypothetical protein ES702_06294 [subsurface metagenome]
MHKLTVTISARLYDPHGRLIRKFRPRAAHSFLAQFIEFLQVQMGQIQTSITKTDNTEVDANVSTQNLRVNAGSSTLTWGMLIGSGTNPVDIDDYKLQTQITTDLTVSIHTFVLSYPTASSRRLVISRTFTNAMDSPMAIEEVALYSLLDPSHFICLDRTLYSVSIPAASSLDLIYRIDVSV